MILFYQPLIPEGIHHLDEDESRHCVKVLRKNNGDEIHLTDGKGFFYDAVIVDANARKCSFTIRSSTPQKHVDYYIHIAISPTKNADRIEWFVEKAVEFGVDTITLMDCKHTERSHLKTDRLNKVAVSAMKQSLKATLPVIRPLTPLPEVILSSKESSRYIAYVDNENPDTLLELAKGKKDHIVLIGPEGDFHPGELEQALQAGFRKVSLGKSRLRTETAGIAACHTIHLANWNS